MGVSYIIIRKWPITNSNKLRCIDASLTNVQDTYSNINPLNQQTAIVYTFDNNGLYQKSQKNELPPNIKSSLFDIKSYYSPLNTLVYFINCFATENTGNFYFYNKDGTLANSISSYPINTNFSQIIQYKVDSSFTDTNNKKYSQIVFPNYFYTGSSLTNYKIFIQGNILNVDPQSIFTTVLNDDPILNSNFSIRSNSSNSNITTLTLNSIIDTSKIIRQNLPEIYYWSSSISATPLNAIVSLNTGYYNNIFNITKIYGTTPSLISSTGTYYIVYTNTLGNLINLEVSSITLYRGLYSITTTSPMLDNSFYPFVQLATVNNNVNYTLQFYPGSLNLPVYFKITLNSITIPNRPVKSYDYSGVRYLLDFPYIYLVIVNTDDNGTIDPNIFNNFYTNNIDRSNSAIFTLPTTSLGGGTNFTNISSSYVPKIKFSPGYYNIRIKLLDPDGNLIIFDNTPTISSDTSFKGSIIPDKLMRIVLSLTLNPA